jgi:hypothetical protein
MGAEHTTITRFRFKESATMFAVIKKLAGIREHCLGFMMTALKIDISAVNHG